MLSLSSSSSEDESRRWIAIGDDVGIDMGVEDDDGGILFYALEQEKDDEWKEQVSRATGIQVSRYSSFIEYFS